jgi:hypothetical protein
VTLKNAELVCKVPLKMLTCASDIFKGNLQSAVKKFIHIFVKVPLKWVEALCKVRLNMGRGTLQVRLKILFLGAFFKARQ